MQRCCSMFLGALHLSVKWQRWGGWWWKIPWEQRGFSVWPLQKPILSPGRACR